MVSHSDGDLQGLESPSTKGSDASTLTRALISPVQPAPPVLSPQSSDQRSPPEFGRLGGNNPFSILDDGFVQSQSQVRDAENLQGKISSISPSNSPAQAPTVPDLLTESSPTSLVTRWSTYFILTKNMMH